ncbi:MAG: hypothetical protein K0R24_2398 [Gammaproteobacteria bacterium]|jgi:hypothetical protein|nr:hypothetical protein [Gammaproteobacteria bacterium]
MSRYIIPLFSLIIGATLGGCVPTQKQPTIQDVSKTVIMSQVPSAKEVTLIPVGYTTCYTVNPSFYQHMWIPAHRVCEYTNAADHSKTVWVDGYWMCTRYDLEKKGNECGYWLWKKAHWSSHSVLY